jgi:hypothetical protein
MDSKEPTVETWVNLMETWPADGWDGAAEIISHHSQRVNEVVSKLDKSNPNWRESVPEKWKRYAK